MCLQIQQSSRRRSRSKKRKRSIVTSMPPFDRRLFSVCLDNKVEDAGGRNRVRTLIFAFFLDEYSQMLLLPSHGRNGLHVRHRSPDCFLALAMNSVLYTSSYLPGHDDQVFTCIAGPRVSYHTAPGRTLHPVFIYGALSAAAPVR